jgi:exosortase family protein XrtF
MLKRILKDEKQRRIASFVIKAVGLYLLWFIAYDFYLAPSGIIDAWLNNRVARDGVALLNLLGYNGSALPGIDQTVMCIDGIEMVGVGNPCNGLELFALFTGFILCFPGHWKTKLWFIPMGILIIHLVNVIRAAVLALIQKNAPEQLDFNHHYTFTIIVYTVIFVLWMLWTNKFSPKNPAKSEVE